MNSTNSTHTIDLLSLLTKRLQESPPTRDLAPVLPGFIDFSFGTPSPLTFPLEEMRSVVQVSVTEMSLNYCPDRGSEHLLLSLSRWLSQWHDISPDIENLIITNGALDGIALTVDAFVENGDVILVESPSYWRAMLLFKNAGAEIHHVPLEFDGIDISCLEDKIRKLLRNGKRPKLLYTIPDHHNPTGITMSRSKREALLSLCEKYEILVLEDSAYSPLTYEGSIPSSLYSLSRYGHVIQLGTLTKVLCPGIRLGWLAMPDYISRHILKLKRDNGTNPFASEIGAHLLNNIDWNIRFAYIRTFYRQRLNALVDALELIPSDFARTRKPSGGFYVWVGIKDNVSLVELENISNGFGVGFIPGRLCASDSDSMQHYIRLAFSDLSVSDIRNGVARIHKALLRCI